MTDLNIRPVMPQEIDQIASFISTGYYDDIFFKWTVDDDDVRYKIVTDYYKVYLSAKGCVAHVVQTTTKEILAAAVWLPHDVDGSIYDDIDKAAGIYADRFRAVADMSHLSEPPMAPFFQLVGFVVDKKAQGTGLGVAMLKYHLDMFDRVGIPTYLEASTPFNGGGVYGKFGYQPIGELIVFTKSAVLYPLWRPANQRQQITFGGYKWQVLEAHNNSMLLLAEQVLELGKYHNTYEAITWEKCSMRKYLNTDFYNSFPPEEQAQILEIQTNNSDNPWFCVNGGSPTNDKVFLLSIEETVRYMGDSGQLKNPVNKFFIDDNFNDKRKTVMADNVPARWLLRTPGSLPNFVSVVNIEGKISVVGDFVNRSSTELFHVGVRPAILVSLQK